MAEKEKRTWSSTGALSGRGLRSVEEQSGEASVAQKNEERAGSGSFGQGDVGVERRARLCAPGARRRRWTPRRAETSYIQDIYVDNSTTKTTSVTCVAGRSFPQPLLHSTH